MLRPDQHLGGYRLISHLGAGGMGEVWKAEDTALGRTVAIKILPPAVATDPEAMHRMRREARTAAQLYHPNIATIHAFEEEGGQSFIVMEFVEGVPLSALIHRGPMAEADVCRIGRAIADALGEAHANGIIHRDIKPDNVIVNGPRVKVLDFGVAKRIGPEALDPKEPTAFRTQTGFIMGTIAYMSPEQALAKKLDPRTDIFSLGVVLYEMLTGRLPFDGESVTETLMLIVRDEPKPLQKVSPGLEWIVRKCLAKNADERFANAREVSEALERQLAYAPTMGTGARYIAGQQTAPPQAAPARRSRWPLFAAISVLAIVGVMVAALLLKPKPDVAAAPAKPAGTMTPVAMTTTIEVAAAEPATVVEDQAPQPTTTTAVVIEPVDKPQSYEKTADDFYNEGLALLVERQPFRARQAFAAAVERDPEHARAHFRLGEMALFGRDFGEARAELEQALEHSERLDARERKLSELGLAVLDRDRHRADTLVEEIAEMSPRDPDLARFRELVEGGPRQPLRALRPRP